MTMGYTSYYGWPYVKVEPGVEQCGFEIEVTLSLMTLKAASEAETRAEIVQYLLSLDREGAEALVSTASVKPARPLYSWSDV
jgi:hypothetical protein